MGAEKKEQMAMSEFENALNDLDGDAALAAGRDILDRLHAARRHEHALCMEVRHLELTKEEREAIISLCYFTEQPEQLDAVTAKHAAATLRGFLARTQK